MTSTYSMRPTPNPQQIKATAPSHSVWVAASAGTGKTKVLTDRLLRLLLEGVEPHKILCLTFTNAAAIEMQERMYKQLMHWTALDDDALYATLHQLMDTTPTEETLNHARILFAHMLDSAEAIRIQTIHAFCQNLLRRFPLEAHIPPNFQLMDDMTTKEAMKHAWQMLLHSTESPVIAALRKLSQLFIEETLVSLLEEMVTKRHNTQRFLLHYPTDEERRHALCEQLAINPSYRHLSKEEIEHRIIDADTGLIEAAHILRSGGINDQKRSNIIARWMAYDHTARKQHIADYKTAFFTQKGEPSKQLISKKLAETHPNIAALLYAEQERLHTLFEQYNAVYTIDITLHVITLAAHMLQHYETYKAEQSFLDYDDLIVHTKALLTHPEIAPWILYKLDGGLDHILVDEAQDTSAIQWEIITALTEEFFAGESAREERRTLFVVGDAKQSIYSFQDAYPQAFYYMQHYFEQHAENALCPWHNITLDVSYRSTDAVLTLVDTLFAQTSLQSAILATQPITHHIHRQGHGGRVELWPIFSDKDTQHDDIPKWQLPLAYYHSKPAEVRLAESIAATIKSWLTARRILPSKGRPIEPKDILILVRRRGKIVHYLTQELKKLAIPVAGADRMLLTDHLAICDLIALAKVTLLPEDDLTLATLLKSPFFGLSEEALFTLAYDRGTHSLWQRLHAAEQHHAIVATLHKWIEQAALLSPYNFFTTLLEGQNGRRLLANHFGNEVHDPLDAFLALAHHYEQHHIPNMEQFIQQLISRNAEVKRELDAQSNEIRIMTIHGAKGLQAPIVFLPDTTQTPQANTSSLTWSEHDIAAPIISPNPYTTSTIKQWRNHEKQKEYDEYIRLLYVALTRAEDELYICGASSKASPTKHSWYHLLSETIRPLGSTTASHHLSLDEEIWHITSQHNAISPSLTTEKHEMPESLPEYLRRPVTTDHATSPPLKPSQNSTYTPPIISPLHSEAPIEKGTIIHQLLYLLPDVSNTQYYETAKTYIDHHHPEIAESNKIALIEEACNVLQHPTIAPLFDLPAVAENMITGYINTIPVLGQIDRLIDHGDHFLIIDYKTGNPATTTHNTPPAYIEQLALYHKILQDLLTEKPIKCALLWTQNQTLMPIPQEKLEHALTTLLDQNTELASPIAT